MAAGAVAWASVRGKERRLEEKWRTVHVLCASVDVSEGTELEGAMIAVKELPAQFVSASFIKVGDDGSVEQDGPVGQRLTVPLKAGDPILISQLESARAADFSSMITPTGRAVTIDVQEKTAVGLWVRPNDHVDVIGSVRDQETQGLRVVTLLQNIVVLATGHATARTALVTDEDKHFQSVTLLVLPEEAEILTLAQEMGTLTLLLRNPEDLDSQEKRAVVDEKTLLRGERANELQQKRYRTIQIIRGNKSSAGAAGVALKSE
jgi:pilus assembly protein CpaB